MIVALTAIPRSTTELKKHPSKQFFVVKYILRNVLHDWNVVPLGRSGDTYRRQKILRVCYDIDQGLSDQSSDLSTQEDANSHLS